MFLQSTVIPVILYSTHDNTTIVEQIVGTAFFINKKGGFLTALHVINGAITLAKEKGMNWGVVVKGDYGENKKSLIAPIINWEAAPNPYDIAFGQLNYSLKKIDNIICPINVMVWQEVATYGYPLNAAKSAPEGFRINLRAHKGIVQRVLLENDLQLPEQSPAGYELSFLIGSGTSGAPLFVYREGKCIVIGVCTGSSRSEEIDEVTEVEENGRIFRETKLRVTEYGIAHDIMSLHEWKISIAGGKTLLNLSLE